MNKDTQKAAALLMTTQDAALAAEAVMLLAKMEDVRSRLMKAYFAVKDVASAALAADEKSTFQEMTAAKEALWVSACDLEA